MSYRVYLTRPDGKQFQLFGNNEYPKRFFKYLKKYSCEMDEDGGFDDFEVMNFNEFFGTIESFIQEEIKRSDTSYFDAQSRYKSTIKMNQNIRKKDNKDLDICERPITVSVYSFLSNAYVFEGYRVLQFLEDYLEYGLEKSIYLLNFGGEIKLRKGCSLHLSGG